jgi:molybdopterin converting factor small subunit
MQINVLVFGQIAEITGNTSFAMVDIADTDQLIERLHSLYPSLINSKYVVAVNKKVVQDNTSLYENCEVAILPPFSGG